MRPTLPHNTYSLPASLLACRPCNPFNRLQGGDAAGLVPEDLGEPDAAGVYTQHTATGTLYFRQVQQHPFATPHWEWSIDKQLWIPTSYVSSAAWRMWPQQQQQ
jgi:hypothetical protein